MALEQRRLAAIVSIDVVGYSRLMNRNESRTHALLKTHLAERVMPSLRRNSGRLVKSTGDGVLAEFDSTVAALSALVQLQQEMANVGREQPDSDRIVFRAGVHLGEVIVEDNDLYGDAVNIAVRLQGEAPPGGIVISRAVREAVGGRINAEFQALGELTLKNIERPIRAFRVEWKEADWQPLAGSDAQPAAAPGRASARDDKPSFAVLAFRNLSGDVSREYFADGISEDIITTLSRITNFVVIARSSSFSYKGRSIDIRQIGGELDVRYVVDGSVQQAAGTSLRISCVLIDAASGKQLWAERYDGSADKLFELQDRITSSIVATIYPKVMGAEIARAQAKPTSSLSAYDFYLRAVALYNRHTESSLDEALALLHQAIAIDPQFSSAWAWVARIHWGRIDRGWSPFRETQALCQEAAKRALEAGRDDPVALALGGFGLACLGGKPEEGVAHIERALALNPNFLMAWRFGGGAHSMLGEHEKAIEYFERAMHLSPLDGDAFETYHGISVPYFFLRRYDQAVEWAERALRDRPRAPLALMMKVAALAMLGDRTVEIPDLVRQLLSMNPRISAKRAMSAFRPSDRELFQTALRAAGIPE